MGQPRPTNGLKRPITTRVMPCWANPLLALARHGTAQPGPSMVGPADLRVVLCHFTALFVSDLSLDCLIDTV